MKENSHTFEAGTYFVGDPLYILEPEDIRHLMWESQNGGIVTGTKELVYTIGKIEGNHLACDHYWVASLPHESGTLYDQKGEGWGFDFGCFAIIPFKWLEHKDIYHGNIITFDKNVECKQLNDVITIGHLVFKLTP